MQTKTDATGTTEYTYDSFGNLRNVTPPTRAAIDYVSTA
jgi:YD repeat-containing protein